MTTTSYDDTGLDDGKLYFYKITSSKDATPDEKKALNSTSIVNIASGLAQKYLFNNETSYDSTRRYLLTNGTYTIQNIPSAHPIALLNNGKTGKISYSVVDDVNSPIVIKVSGGDTNPDINGDYYTFKDSGGNTISIADGGFRFMRGKTYKFEADNIGGIHPFKIKMSNVFQNDNNSSNSGITGSSGSITITIPSNHSTTAGHFYYQCGGHGGMKANLNLLYKSLSGTTNDASYDFYYGNVTITVSDDFDKVSVYCFYHGYMGGENLFEYGIVEQGKPDSIPAKLGIVTKLPNPSNVTAVIDRFNGVEVTFDASGAKYDIEQSSDGGANWTSESTDATTKKFNKSGLVDGTAYKYRVKGKEKEVSFTFDKTTTLTDEVLKMTTTDLNNNNKWTWTI